MSGAVPTLRALVADPGLRLRALTAGSGLDRPVSWVAVSELEDPTPYLDGGELLLTTGLRGAVEGAAATDYVARLRAAGVVGLGFGVGVVHEDVPGALLAAAREQELTLLEVPRPTPFIAVGKALGELLAAQRVHAAEQRLRTVRSLAAAAAGRGDRDATPVLRRLARAVRGWAAVLGPDGAVREAWPAAVRHEPPPLLRRAVGELAAGTGVAGSGSSEDASGWCVLQPLGVEGADGRLACGGTDPSGRDNALVGLAAALLTVAGAHPVGSLAAGPSGAEAAGRSLGLALALAGRALPDELPAAVRGPLAAPDLRVADVARDAPVEAARHAGGRLLAELVEGERRVLAWAGDVDEAVLAALAGVDGGASRSGPVSALPRLRAAAGREAGLGRAGTGLRREDGVAGVPTVAALASPADRAAFAAAVLAPLTGGQEGAELLASLAAFLRWNGHMDRAAADVGVHRHTLRHRMTRVSALLARDLDDAQSRAELWLALGWLEPPPD